jgi:hypothetical protein
MAIMPQASNMSDFEGKLAQLGSPGRRNPEDASQLCSGNWPLVVLSLIHTNGDAMQTE